MTEQTTRPPRETYWATMHVPESVRLADEWTDANTPKTFRPVRFQRCITRFVGAKYPAIYTRIYAGDL